MARQERIGELLGRERNSWEESILENWNLPERCGGSWMYTVLRKGNETCGRSLININRLI